VGANFKSDGIDVTVVAGNADADDAAGGDVGGGPVLLIVAAAAIAAVPDVSTQSGGTTIAVGACGGGMTDR
jgi:hypothetical protein